MDYVKSNSHFDYYGEENDGSHLFTTRKYGDVGAETPGTEDIREANRMKKEVEGKFPEVKVILEAVDEWIYLRIKNR